MGLRNNEQPINAQQFSMKNHLDVSCVKRLRTHTPRAYFDQKLRSVLGTGVYEKNIYKCVWIFTTDIIHEHKRFISAVQTIKMFCLQNLNYVETKGNMRTKILLPKVKFCWVTMVSNIHE